MLQWELTNMCGGNKDEWHPIVYQPTLDENGVQKVFPPDSEFPGKPMWSHTPIMEVMLWGVFQYNVWEITEDNWKEVWTRMRLYEIASGNTWLQMEHNHQDRPLKPEEVKQFVGFKINGGEESKRKFHGRVIRMMRDQIGKELKRWEEGVEKESKATIKNVKTHYRCKCGASTLSHKGAPLTVCKECATEITHKVQVAEVE